MFLFLCLVALHLAFTRESGSCTCSSGPCFYLGGGLPGYIYYPFNIAMFVLFAVAAWIGTIAVLRRAPAKRYLSGFAMAVGAMVLASFSDFGDYHSVCSGENEHRFYLGIYGGASPRLSVITAKDVLDRLLYPLDER